MTPQALGARGFLSLLFHGQKATDVVQSALETGLLAKLDEGPITLGDLCGELDMRPLRLYKLLDCLESLGLASREHSSDDILEARYRSVVPLEKAALDVVGPESIERDRDRHPWRKLHGRLNDVLRGNHALSDGDFSWPPVTAEQVSSFEHSMAAGIGPIAESFDAARCLLMPDRSPEGQRWLDIGGGDGALAVHLAGLNPFLRVDVYNLPTVRPLVEERVGGTCLEERVGFVAGDFLNEPIPSGYDVLSFVRVLHDWPTHLARELVCKAREALAPGGRIIICEEFRNPERLAVQFFWTYFLVGVDSCVSRLRERDFYTRLLVEEGFGEARVLPGPFDIIFAERT